MAKDWAGDGRELSHHVTREEAGWGATVWFGDGETARRYIYRTRRQARDGDISDSPGRQGRIK